jgi:hypothetical protein
MKGRYGIIEHNPRKRFLYLNLTDSFGNTIEKFQNKGAIIKGPRIAILIQNKTWLAFFKLSTKKLENIHKVTPAVKRVNRMLIIFLFFRRIKVDSVIQNTNINIYIKLAKFGSIFM